MLKGILFLIGYCITLLDSSFRTYQDCKIRLVLEDTNTLFTSVALVYKLFYETLGERREKDSFTVGYFLQIPSSSKGFPQPCFVQRKCAWTQRLMSALSSFTTMKVLTLFILLGSRSYYLQAGTDWISFGLEFPFHWLHLCQHSPHKNRKEPLLGVTCISSRLIFHSLQPTFVPFSFLVSQLLEEILLSAKA